MFVTAASTDGADRQTPQRGAPLPIGPALPIALSMRDDRENGAAAS